MNTHRLFSPFLLAVSLLVGATGRADAACPTPLVRAIPTSPPSDLRQADSRFGSAVALGGGADTQEGVSFPLFAAISAPLDDTAGEVAAYRVVDGALSFEKILTRSDPSHFDRFGSALAMAREAPVLAVGADSHNGPNDLSETGKVYLFERRGNAWEEVSRVAAGNPERKDHFGAAVALSADGNVLVVGAPDMDGDHEDTGAVLVFRRQGNSDWRSETLTLPVLEAGDELGWSVAVNADGTQVVAGAPQFLADRQAGPGKAFRFLYQNGSWQEGEKLRLDANPGDAFGFSVAILGSGLIAVGAPGADRGENNTGAIYLFQADRLAQTLEACESAKEAELGYSLATDGTTLLAGARRADSKTGAAYLFRCPANSCGNAMIKLAAGPSGAELGRSVAVLRDLALAGAPLGQNEAGSAVAYDLGGVVVTKPKLTGVGGKLVPGRDLTLTFEVANRSTERLDLPIDLLFPAKLNNPILCRQAQCNLPILEPGHAVDTLSIQGPAVVTYTITGTISPILRGEIEASLTARIPANFFEPTPEGLSQSDHRVLQPMATLRIDLGAPNKAIPGDPSLDFTLQVKNEGPSAILGSKIETNIPNVPPRIKDVQWCIRQRCTPCTKTGSPIKCILDRGTDLSPGRQIDFKISGMVPEAAVGNLRMNVSAKPAQGEPGAQETSRTVQLDPTATIAVAVDTLPGSDRITMVPGAPNEHLSYEVTIEHTLGSSLFRGAHFEATRDPEIACFLSCLRSTRRSTCQATGPLGVDVKNLSKGDLVKLNLDCGLLPASAANLRGEIPGPTFQPSRKMPNSLGIVIVGNPSLHGDPITLDPSAKLQFLELALTDPLPIVPGKATHYRLEIANRGCSDPPDTTGCSDSPLTRLFPCTAENPSQCPTVKLVCSNTFECISNPAGANQSTICVFPLAVGSSRTCVATVTPASGMRDNLVVTAVARGTWPHSDPEPRRVFAESDPEILTPQANLNVAISDAEEITIDPPTSTDPPIPGAQFKVNISNAGPSDAREVITSLTLPALLPAENLTWSPEDGTGEPKLGNESWTLDVIAEPDLSMQRGRTLVASGPFAVPTPPLRGPLVVRASTTSEDAFPKGSRDSGFTQVHVSAAQPVASAALVVKGEFKPDGHVCFTAFLDNNTTKPVKNEDPDPATHAFSVKLPQGLTINEQLEDCEMTPGVMGAEDGTIYWDGTIPAQELQPLPLQFGATIDHMPPQWICVQATTSLGFKEPAVPEEEVPFVTGTHCPYNTEDESATIFKVPDGTAVPLENLPAICGAPENSEPVHCGDFFKEPPAE